MQSAHSDPNLLSDDSGPNTVAEFFADPPDWLTSQLKVYRQDPERHFKPLCSAVAAVVLEDAARWKEVADEVRLAVQPRTTVVNHDSGQRYDIYIGRGKRGSGLKKSKWHNPYVVGKDGTREECIERFERDFLAGALEAGPENLSEIRGKILGCHCAPKDCHGHVLARIADSHARIAPPA